MRQTAEVRSGCFGSIILGSIIASSDTGSRWRTAWRKPAISRRRARPRLGRSSRPMRAQGRPGARCTRGLVCNVHKVRTRAYRSSGEHPAFSAQWFDGLWRALPGDEFALASVIGALTVLRDPVGLAKTSADLTPATGARTTRFCRARTAFAKRARRCRVHRPSGTQARPVTGLRAGERSGSAAISNSGANTS